MKQLQQPKCTVCHSYNLQASLSFGTQPPSNRFQNLKAGNIAKSDCYPLSLGHCNQCGTIQLVDRIPIETIRPRYNWLIYNEPEEHLDDVASKLKDLVGISPSSRFLGVTYKDQSTLERMNSIGFSNTACINEVDLHRSEQPFGLETIQDILSSDGTISRIRETYGSADMLVVRHIIEHATDANRFIRSLKGLLAPKGYVMFELPDSERIFSMGSHAFIWEEHISYFTETTIDLLAGAVGAERVWLKRYCYPYEDSLIVVLQFTTTGDKPNPGSILGDPEASARKLAGFAAKLDTSRVKWRKKLEAIHAKGQKIAVFGAGHLAAKFVNYYGLADLIDCVVDDHPKKIGLLMPGSRLPIVSSSELLARDICVCISTLSPESEVKVRGKLSSFFDAGGSFFPAFDQA